MENSMRTLDGLDLLVHDFSLYGEFTEETENKIFGEKPYIPEQEGPERDAAIEKAAERLAEIKCMLERMPDFVAKQEEAECDAEEEDEEKSDPCTYAGFDISPLVHDTVYGHPINGFTVETVFGKMPSLSESPDNDTRDMAYEDRSAYCRNVREAKKKAKVIISDAKLLLEA